MSLKFFPGRAGDYGCLLQILPGNTGLLSLSINAINYRDKHYASAFRAFVKKRQCCANGDQGKLIKTR